MVAEVFSRAGLGTPSRLLVAAADRPVGRASGLLWPCRPWPQIRWCLSQSLCWQKEPQYRAMLQPLHVSLALRPQFQQLCKTRGATLQNAFSSQELEVGADSTALGGTVHPPLA